MHIRIQMIFGCVYVMLIASRVKICCIGSDERATKGNVDPKETEWLDPGNMLDTDLSTFKTVWLAKFLSLLFVRLVYCSKWQLLLGSSNFPGSFQPTGLASAESLEAQFFGQLIHCIKTQCVKVYIYIKVLQLSVLVLFLSFLL